MASCKLVRLQLKLPLPVPFVTLPFAVVGSGVVLYTIPRSVILPPPSLVTQPSTIADLSETLVAIIVETIGK